MTEPATPFLLKTSLGHLPESKRRQLQEITRLLRRILKVHYLILFGSYARGDLVEDPDNRYFSDYDLLVLASKRELKKTERWAVWERQVKALAGNIPVTLLTHTLDDVNEELRLGNYFFGDIVKEGIVLYAGGKRHLITPQKLSPEERLMVYDKIVLEPQCYTSCQAVYGGF